MVLYGELKIKILEWMILIFENIFFGKGGDVKNAFTFFWKIFVTLTVLNASRLFVFKIIEFVIVVEFLFLTFFFLNFFEEY